MARKRFYVKVTRDVAYDQEIQLVADDMRVAYSGAVAFVGETDDDQIAMFPRGKWLGVRTEDVDDETRRGIERWDHERPIASYTGLPE